MVYPWESNWVELVDVDAVSAQTLDMALFQRLVVGIVTEAIKQRAYFHAFLALLAQDIE